MADETLSEQILRENRAVLAEMLGHRFVEDIKADRLPAPVFHRYLVYEGAFVETAISIFAYATAKAETITQKRWLTSVLDALANQQVVYFEETFAALGIDPSVYDTRLPEVEAFRSGMLEIARERSYLDIVAAMFAAEWMYWSWCREADAYPISDPILRRWVALHADETFASQALWLKGQLDEYGYRLPSEQRAMLSKTFGRVIRLEIDFHQAPYRA